ncbi:MAG: 1-phosphofructokinase [Vallitaleaceae bacterium]|nr:1-phosphofructokinase [Vallitaleaceae bacterium]
MYKQKMELLRMELNQLFDEEDASVEIILKKSQVLDEYILQSMLEDELKNTFSELGESTLDELMLFLDKIQIFQEMYQSIRLVDPMTKKVFDLKANEIIESEHICHTFWEKKMICENCISSRADHENVPIFKIEHTKNFVYLVTAVPILVNGRKLVIELLKCSSNEKELASDLKVFKMIDAMNQEVAVSKELSQINKGCESMVTTITLNPAIDKTITVEKLELGSVNRVGNAVYETGGKGLNVSKVVGRLGTKTTAIGYLGEVNKTQMRDLMRGEAIETDFIYLPAETRTNTVIVELEQGQTTNINEEGFFVNEKHFQEMKALVAHYAETSDYMVFSGSAPKGINTNIYRELMELVGDRTLTVLDADDEMLVEGLKGRPYLIKPNIHELEHAFDTELSSDEEIIALSRKIIEQFGTKIVLISMGGEGSLLVTQEEAYKALPLPVVVLSTVGAGDSFVGGFLHGLVSKLPLTQCLAYGTVCGALAITRDGVSNFTIEEVETLLTQVIIQKK